jgi:geranylgeranyl reductase family protein
MPSGCYDVIIAGGGPAGSMTAYLLARAGLRTILFDASEFPRVKACGGGLQARALSNIPFDISHLLRGTMRQMTLSMQLSRAITRIYPEPLVYGILRSEFDHFLLQRAHEAGVTIRELTPLRTIDAADNHPISIRIGNEEIRSQFLVGADGANSVVRKILNERAGYFWQAAVYCEVPEEYLDEGVYCRDCMRIDWGTLPSGYAWAFPKNGYMNIGAGAPILIARHLKNYVRRFIDRTGLVKPAYRDKVTLAGHQLPTVTGNSRFADKRVLLVGDAAGLVDPFTGDGISFACESARVAADCILEAFQRGVLDLSAYNARLRTHIANELMWSRKLVSISVAFPKLIYRLFQKNDRVWQTFCRTLRGEESFEQLKKDVLGPLEFAWNAVDLFTRFRERRILRPKVGQA